MRSRAARMVFSALACVALGATAFFLNNTEHTLRERQAVLGAFDRQAREVAMHMAEVRAGQQAYVAAGQSAAAWLPKVAALLPLTRDAIAALRGLAASGEARKSLDAASATIAELANIDARARAYLSGGEVLMASDVVFTEGVDAAASAARQIDRARLEEERAFDADQADLRRIEVYAAGGASAFTILILISMALSPAARAPVVLDAAASDAVSDLPLITQASLADVEALRPAPPRAIAEVVPDHATLALSATAALCTDLSRVRDAAGLTRLLGRAAGVLDARGLVVWLGSADGTVLRAVATHGYSDQTVALMRPVPRGADNAAAAAYRTGALQVVAAQPGTSLGAVVAPISGTEGCIGALAAEIKDDGEVSETVHALASIIAAQLAGLLSPAQASARDVKAASA